MCAYIHKLTDAYVHDDDVYFKKIRTRVSRNLILHENAFMIGLGEEYSLVENALSNGSSYNGAVLWVPIYGPSGMTASTSFYMQTHICIYTSKYIYIYIYIHTHTHMLYLMAAHKIEPYCGFPFMALQVGVLRRTYRQDYENPFSML
jgi:hypothetical protein